jgi:hypothetical protein
MSASVSLSLRYLGRGTVSRMPLFDICLQKSRRLVIRWFFALECFVSLRYGKSEASYAVWGFKLWSIFDDLRPCLRNAAMRDERASFDVHIRVEDHLCGPSLIHLQLLYSIANTTSKTLLRRILDSQTPRSQSSLESSGRTSRWR